MKIVTQVAMFVRNAPGTLAEICSYLGQHDININGVSVSDAIDHAVVRFIVDQPRKASFLLEERGLLVVDTHVLAVDLENVPGRLATVARALADAGLDIHYVYGAHAPGSSAGQVYFRVDEPERALRVLSEVTSSAA